MSIFVGVDVGGTNTDAAAVSSASRRVVGSVKSPTTADVESGVIAAIEALLRTIELDPSEVDAVMIGTTHFVNALVQGRELQRTAVIRLCGPATRALPPMVDWPERLRTVADGHVYLLDGGVEYDGRELAPLADDEIVAVAERLVDAGIDTVAVSSVFSSIDPSHERAVADRLTGLVPGLRVSLSSQLGRVGLLERENATIVNACLRSLATRVMSSFERSIADLGIVAPLYITQNDGTLMDAERAAGSPVVTFASGPTNSMRGAAFLSSVTDAAVIDVGGTTSDVGVLRQGFPREAALATEVAGVRTNFRMPDVMSIGVGGGSLVSTDDGEVVVGPHSVGYRLADEALVFGGPTLTATDIAVAAGLAQVGDPSKVSHLDTGMVADALAEIRRRVGDGLDRMKTGPGLVPVVLVGGGRILLDDVPGASSVTVPDHHAVANAVGAAIAQVGGESERVVQLTDGPRDEQLDSVRGDAVARCVAAGASARTVEVVEVEEVPLAYLPSNAVRMKVKAVGDLALGAAP